MIRCPVKDCQFLNRAEGLCKLNEIKLNDSKKCITYRQDKVYLDWTLAEFLYSYTKLRGFDPETELMLSMAPPLHHTPCGNAGEEEKQVCHE